MVGRDLTITRGNQHPLFNHLYSNLHNKIKIKNIDFPDDDNNVEICVHHCYKFHSPTVTCDIYCHHFTTNRKLRFTHIHSINNSKLIFSVSIQIPHQFIIPGFRRKLANRLWAQHWWNSVVLFV